MLFLTKRSSASRHAPSSPSSPNEDSTLPHLVEDSDEDDCSEDNMKKKYSKESCYDETNHGKKQFHPRSLSQQLRLFLLTGRVSRTLFQVMTVTFFAVTICWMAHRHRNHTRVLRIPRADRWHVLQEAGFTAKPRMVSMYFQDVASDSFTHRVHAIRPPRTEKEWLGMLQKRLGHRRQDEEQQEENDGEDGNGNREGKEENRHSHHHDHHRHRHPHILHVDPMTDYEVRKHIIEASEDYEEDKPSENPEGCVPQHEWQTKLYPVCNNIHEHSILSDRLFQAPIIDSHKDLSHRGPNRPHKAHKMRRELTEETAATHHVSAHHHHHHHHHHQEDKPTQFRLLANGYWRDTWRMKEPGQGSLAFKTMRYEHNVSEYVLDKQRRDALTSERLQFSEQTVKLYSYCGTSAIYEYAPGGDLFNFLEQFNTAEEWLDYYSSSERLQLAYNVTSALADVHATEGDDQPTAIVHADFNALQFVAVSEVEPESDDGHHSRHHNKHLSSHKLPHFKLGDFNLARFVYWNPDEDRPCVIRPEAREGYFRAPEEYARLSDLRTEKLDIYSLGNLLYSIVTGHWPFDEVENTDDTRELEALVTGGKRPHVDDVLLQSKDPYVQAMLHAMNMCWPQDPQKRANAKEIREYLAQYLPENHHHRRHRHNRKLEHTSRDEEHYGHGHHHQQQQQQYRRLYPQLSKKYSLRR